MQLDPDLENELEAKKKRLQSEWWQHREATAGPAPSFPQEPIAQVSLPTTTPRASFAEQEETLGEGPSLRTRPSPSPPGPSVGRLANPPLQAQNSSALVEALLQTLTNHLEVQERLLLRLLDTPQGTPHLGGVDAWIASLVGNHEADGERSTYSTRLSTPHREGLESTMAHRGHRTLADALDEALCVGLPALMRLPSKHRHGKRVGRKKKS